MKSMKKMSIAIGCVLISFMLCQFCEKCASKETQTEEKSGMTTDTDGMAEYYGYYQITQFYPTIYYGKIKYDCLPEQEADMMLGRIVIIEPERLVTYDSERRLGTREGRDGFGGKYIIKEYTLDNPKYE